MNTKKLLLTPLILYSLTSLASEIQIDFANSLNGNSSGETYNVVPNSEATTLNHPLATSGRFILNDLLDSSGIATGAQVRLEAYNNGAGLLRAGQGKVDEFSFEPVNGIDISATHDSFEICRLRLVVEDV